MHDFQLTPSQLQAVQAPGGSPILVSAAAGSGKTRVLTQRLIARVLAGEDIDRFLVITFTRAAAAELRGRILTELNERTAAAPGDRRLRRQSALLYRAQIGTIDSFCTSLVRENAHLLGVSPGFAMLDEDRAQALRARALEDVLDRAYERIETDEGLRTLVDSVGAGRDDSRLSELILDLDRQLQSHAYPKKWADAALAMLDTTGKTDAGQTVWGRYLLEDAAEEAAYRAEELDKTIAITTQPEHAAAMEGYTNSLLEMAAWFRDLVRAAAEGWDAARRVLTRPDPRLGKVKKDADSTVRETAKALWDESKAAAARLRKALVGDSPELLAGIAGSRAPLGALMELVWELQQEYTDRKRRADACDFADVEHMCVQLLCGQDGEATPLAKTVSDRFAEVMVDEYQDVNAVQDLIFRRVSHEGRDLFMVGDVKQSIYRFRLAEPAIFNGKMSAFADGSQGQRVLLRENFRSRACVLDACNSVFERIMSPALGDVAYDDEARLIPQAAYPASGEVRPELRVLEPSADGEEDAPDRTLLEARYVAGRIRAMVEGRELISDGQGGQRPVEYGDIALLLRTPNTTGAAYRRALAEAGVPVNARQGSAFFSQPEVSFALAMLTVADNPRQDVPLIAALQGLPFGFTPDDLSAIRDADQGQFWDALQLRAQTDERCRRFVELAEDLRSFAREEATDRVLRRLYDRTELLTICAVMPDASRRIGDLMQLYEYARKFEQDGGRGLFRFVSWLQELERRGMEPPASVIGGAVQIMSIHKSKGLEFPVVFLADNGHGWNRGQAAHVLCHRTLGLGMRVTDPVRGVRWPTLPWRAIERMSRQEDLSEQERVLYVAMTRAKERLIMTCTMAKAAEKLAALSVPADGPISPRVLSSAPNTAFWLLRAAAADGGRTLDMALADSVAASAAPVQPDRDRPPADPALTRALDQRLAWTYPYAAAVTLPSKLTATSVRELSPVAADAEAAQLPQTPVTAAAPLRRPDFGRGTRPLSGAERGVAAHLVMQHIDLAKTNTEAEIFAEIARMARMGFLDQHQAAAADPGDILAFFRSDLGQRLLAADHVHREFRFSLLCPATLWYPQAPAGEEILLQGVVDCCIEEAGVLTVIDFKTDARVEPERHTPQLQAYAAAMERIFHKPVRQAALWYLRRRQAAFCPLEKR